MDQNREDQYSDCSSVIIKNFLICMIYLDLKSQLKQTHLPGSELRLSWSSAHPPNQPVTDPLGIIPKLRNYGFGDLRPLTSLLKVIS